VKRARDPLVLSAIAFAVLFTTTIAVLTFGPFTDLGLLGSLMVGLPLVAATAFALIRFRKEVDR
jgi:hypothetical protein